MAHRYRRRRFRRFIARVVENMVEDLVNLPICILLVWTQVWIWKPDISTHTVWFLIFAIWIVPQPRRANGN